jgi:hypothetical protein
MKSAREIGITPSARTGIKLPQKTSPNLGSRNQGAADPFKPPASTPPAKVALHVERKKR